MYLPLLEFLRTALCCIFCFAFADGRTKVDISVNGDQVVKTGIARYTIYDITVKKDRILTISCLSFLSLPSTISLYQNGSLLNSSNTNNAFKKFTFEKGMDVNSAEGTYSCRFNFSLQAYNESQLEYFIERKVQIFTEVEKEICTSSVGLSGYLGERVTFHCEGLDYDLHVAFFQAGQLLRSQHSLQVSILESNTTFQCIDELYELSKCTLSLEVHKSLQVAISPTNFTLDSQEMSFTCNSTPPRMLYWEIIGDDGNVFDLNDIGHVLEDGSNITINQEAGLSFLNIPSTIKDKADLRIHKIVCYAYSTPIPHVVYATVEPIPNCNKTCECSPTLCTYPPQTSFQNFEDDNGISTMTRFSTSFQGANTEKADTTDSKQDSTSFGPFIPVTGKRREGKITDWKILCPSVIALCEALVILIIAGKWIWGKYRRKCNRPSSKSVLTGGIVSVETVLHDNIVYQSYDS